MLMVSTYRKSVGWSGEENAAVSSEAEDNKALVRHFLGELAKENYAIVDELLSPDFVDRSLPLDQEPGREGYTTWSTGARRG